MRAISGFVEGNFLSLISLILAPPDHILPAKLLLSQATPPIIFLILMPVLARHQSSLLKT